MLMEILYGPFHADLWEKKSDAANLEAQERELHSKNLKDHPQILIFVQEFRSLYWASNNRGLEVEL